MYGRKYRYNAHHLINAVIGGVMQLRSHRGRVWALAMQHWLLAHRLEHKRSPLVPQPTAASVDDVELLLCAGHAHVAQTALLIHSFVIAVAVDMW